MSDPKVLLLDEPSLGLAPKIVKEVFAKIKEINERHKIAIMVVEHNIKSLLNIAHRVYLIDKGKVGFYNSKSLFLPELLYGLRGDGFGFLGALAQNFLT